jgi:hypothetical protein
VVTRDGCQAPVPDGTRVILTGSPVYFELE